MARIDQNHHWTKEEDVALLWFESFLTKGDLSRALAWSLQMSDQSNGILVQSARALDATHLADYY